MLAHSHLSDAELSRLIRETRAEMKAKGIRRLSVFNGGHSPESYRLNALMFELETIRSDRKAKALVGC